MLIPPQIMKRIYTLVIWYRYGRSPFLTGKYLSMGYFPWRCWITKRVYIKVPLLTTPPPAHRNEDGVHPRQAVSTGEMRRKSFKNFYEWWFQICDMSRYVHPEVFDSVGICWPSSWHGGWPDVPGSPKRRWIKSQPTFLHDHRSWLYRYIEISK
jgi:hypothetical protein